METIKMDYKDEIIKTRVGCLGSSDAALLMRVANTGKVPQGDYERLAICKGLIPSVDGFKSRAMQFGDEIENKVYEIMSSCADADNEFFSNPLWESERYVRENVRLISHPDIVRLDHVNKTMHVYEVKTTKMNYQEARRTYRAQLFFHELLGREIISREHKGWKLKVYLVVYDTNGIDDFDSHEYDPDRLTTEVVRGATSMFDVNRALDIVDRFLDDMTEYYGNGDEVDADLLPTLVKSEFDNVVRTLQEIEKRQQYIDDFKQRLYTFMESKDIKSVKNDVFSIVRVCPTESKSSDYKGFYEEYASEHPLKARRMLKKHEKTTKRKGYVQIKINKNDNNQKN